MFNRIVRNRPISGDIKKKNRDIKSKYYKYYIKVRYKIRGMVAIISIFLSKTTIKSLSNETKDIQEKIDQITNISTNITM